MNTLLIVPRLGPKVISIISSVQPFVQQRSSRTRMFLKTPCSAVNIKNHELRQKGEGNQGKQDFHWFTLLNCHLQKNSL